MSGSRDCSFQAGSGEVIVAAAIDRYVWYGSARTVALEFIARSEGVRRKAAAADEEKWLGRLLTGMLARPLANPPKLVLAPCQKRAERMCIK
jgi:hypothetical protein